MTTKILLGLSIALLAIQFIKPDKNDSDIQTNHISGFYSVPDELQQLIKVACNDCHSNKTEYPWYSGVQPVTWWLDHHITEGKQHLNFSDFTNLPIAIQNHKFEEIVEMVEEKEMPLPSYTYFGLHDKADLDEDQRQMIINWVKIQMQVLKDTYPADSLVMPNRRPAASTPAD